MPPERFTHSFYHPSHIEVSEVFRAPVREHHYGFVAARTPEGVPHSRLVEAYPEQLERFERLVLIPKQILDRLPHLSFTSQNAIIVGGRQASIPELNLVIPASFYGRTSESYEHEGHIYVKGAGTPDENGSPTMLYSAYNPNRTPPDERPLGGSYRGLENKVVTYNSYIEQGLDFAVVPVIATPDLPEQVVAGILANTPPDRLNYGIRRGQEQPPDPSFFTLNQVIELAPSDVTAYGFLHPLQDFHDVEVAVERYRAIGIDTENYSGVAERYRDAARRFLEIMPKSLQINEVEPGKLEYTATTLGDVYRYFDEREDVFAYMVREGMYNPFTKDLLLSQADMFFKDWEGVRLSAPISRSSESANDKGAIGDVRNALKVTTTLVIREWLALMRNLRIISEIQQVAQNMPFALATSSVLQNNDLLRQIEQEEFSRLIQEINKSSWIQLTSEEKKGKTTFGLHAKWNREDGKEAFTKNQIPLNMSVFGFQYMTA